MDKKSIKSSSYQTNKDSMKSHQQSQSSNSNNHSVRRSSSLPAISSESRPFVHKNVNRQSGFPGISIDNIYSIWNSMKKNKSSNHLNLSELTTICEAVGLNRNVSNLAAKRVFEALAIDDNGYISFEQFMSIVIEHFDVLDGGKSKETSKEVNFTAGFNENLHDVPNDIIEREVLLQIWTEASIPRVDELLKRIIGVGYDFKCFKYSDIETAIEEEIEKETDTEMIHLLLKAELSLNRHVVSTMKTHLGQVMKENQQLFDEKKEACRKNSILAQDYDEQFEKLAKTKEKSLERDHIEALKKVNDRFTVERDNLMSVNQALESKMKSSDEREKLLMQEIIALKRENKDLEMENIDYHKQIEDLFDKNIELNNKLAISGQYDDEKNAPCNDEIIELLEKIEILQLENSKLRDDNDEYVSDIERLHADMLKLKKNSSTPEPEKTYKKLQIVSTNSEIPPSDPYFNNENKIENEKSISDDSDASEILRKINEKLKNRVDELESSLDLMRQEYEDCENYWQSKLNDERVLNEKNQQTTNKKISDLLERLTDVEEQQVMSRRGRLSPIDEKRNLEAQYMELEEELNEVQNLHETTINEKDLEIEDLKEQLSRWKAKYHEIEESKSSKVSVYSQHTKDGSEDLSESETSSSEEIEGMKMEINQLKVEILDLIAYRKNLHKELYALQNKLQTTSDTIHPTISKKLEKYQMKNKFLKSIIQKQHMAESKMSAFWLQNNEELNRLKHELDLKENLIFDQANKLTSADVLVKDLYVENSQLHVSIRDLEHKLSRLTMNHPMNSLEHFTSTVN